jgi:ribosomal protein S27AE
MSDRIPRFSLPDSWAVKARCPVCSAAMVQIIHDQDAPDRMTCGRCHCIFELEDGGAYIRFSVLPEALVETLGYRWVSNQEIEQAIADLIPKRKPQEPLPTAVQLDSEPAPSGSYLDARSISQTTPEASLEYVSLTDHTQPEPDVQNPYVDDSSPDEAVLDAYSQAGESLEQTPFASENDYFPGLSENGPQVTRVTGQEYDPEVIAAIVLRRATKLYGLGNNSEQVKVILAYDKNLTSESIEEAVKMIRKIEETKRNHNRRIFILAGGGALGTVIIIVIILILLRFIVVAGQDNTIPSLTPTPAQLLPFLFRV